MKEYIIGADIGGTTVKLGIFKIDGTLLSKWEIPTRTENAGSAILSDIADSCKTKIKELNLTLDQFAGIGAGVPGPVLKNGFVDRCVNLGWNQVQAKDILEKEMGIPAAIGNDANVAALGEMWLGGGKGYDNVVMVTLGTGVGGGIIVNGDIIDGSHGYGGEIGHMTMNPAETEKCNCGKRGCLEQYCSATGIVRVTKQNLEKYQGNTCLREIAPITAKDIFDAAKAGDSFAVEQVNLFADTLARGLSFISGVVDPDVFVIGGGVSKAGDIIIDSVAKAYDVYSYGKQKDTKFVLATLSNDAGICGCAKMILN